MGQFEVILDAMKRRGGDPRPWHEIARAMELLIAYGRSEGWEGDAKIRRSAEDATETSWPILQRYLSVFRRAQAIASKEGLHVDQLLCDGFNGAELAVRLYDRNRDDGLTALHDLRHGRQTLAGVRRSLELARGGTADGSIVTRSALLRKRSAGIREVETAFNKDGARLFGDGCKVVRRPPLAFFRQTGVEARLDGKIVGGANILTPDADSTRDQLDMVLPPALLLARYFPRFYLVFSPGADPEAISRAVKAVEDFEARNVGVATTVGEAFDQILKPLDQTPQDPGYGALRDRLKPKSR